jgi:hypothetical protein
MIPARWIGNGTTGLISTLLAVFRRVLTLHVRQPQDGHQESLAGSATQSGECCYIEVFPLIALHF